MKLAFVVNQVATEKDDYSTIRLARRAENRGHDVALIGLGEFIYCEDGSVHANAVLPKGKDFEDDVSFLADVQADDARREQISLEQVDVLMLRSDPANEVATRPWAPTSGLLFAQVAAAQGVIVLNDPTHLTDAQNKTYFQHFPEEVRPATCITMDPKVIVAFIEAHGNSGVIKPLQGSGGHGVFVVRPDDKPNLNQMIDAVVRDGYALVQEYLPKAADGDLRLLMLNGRALQVDGHYACFRRRSSSDDARSNVAVGGKVELAQPDEDALRLAEIVGPKLIKDGMYLAGLDIVGDKLLEINLDTPGGINSAEDLTGADFSGYILDDMERKVRAKKYYRGRLTNDLLSVI